RQPPGIIACSRRKHDTQSVRFEFSLLVESARQNFRAAADDPLCRRLSLVEFFLQGSRPHLYGATLLQYFEVMLLLHVSDLVSENAGELGFVLELRIKAASDEHIAARCGKRVDVV